MAIQINKLLLSSLPTPSSVVASIDKRAGGSDAA